jgi:hypothetical protein
MERPEALVPQDQGQHGQARRCKAEIYAYLASAARQNTHDAAICTPRFHDETMDMLDARYHGSPDIARDAAILASDRWLMHVRRLLGSE